MKKYILLTAIIMLIMGIINTTSCKRASVPDPGTIGTTGHSITLSGSANPLTLYIPRSEPKVTSTITVIAMKYDGTPAAGKDIILESGAYGLFQNREVSRKIPTNSAGIVRVIYEIYPNTDVRLNTTIYIKATLIDEQKPADANIYCYIPLNLVPYVEDDYIRISGKVEDQFSSKGVKNVVIALDSGAAIKTGRGGTYSFIIYGAASQGWYGTITPNMEGASFIPTSITLGSQDAPIYSDRSGQNFYALIKQTIQVSRPQINFDSSASVAESVYVYCAPDSTFRASFFATTSASWVRIGDDSTDVNYSSITGNTPQYIYIRVYANDAVGAIPRSATVDVTATSPQNAVSTATITINQDI